MSQQNPNRFKSYPMIPETNYTGWIVGGLLVLILGLGFVAIMSRANPTAPTAPANSDSQRSAATATTAKSPPAH